MYSVYQHWDPLKVCIVGRSYPPEFYSWIAVPHVRKLFEKIAQETEEDFQNIIRKLEEFGVKVLRPELPKNQNLASKFQPPPMTPRDYTVMIGNTFYQNKGWQIDFYNKVKDCSWPKCTNLEEFENLPISIREECINVHNMYHHLENSGATCYSKIFDHIVQQGNKVVSSPILQINGAMVSRIGRDLYFGTEDYNQSVDTFQLMLDQSFPQYHNHIVNTGGHSDATYCPVAPGLIISLRDVPTYAKTFPGWEVVYLENQSWDQVKPFLHLKQKNQGKWWIPGFEYDQDVVDTVETWLNHWTGYVEETVFDVNMLIIDPKNVIVFSYNKKVFDALDRYGITAHVVPFRHRYFWDGGIHCVTSDLHREGAMQDYFSDRT